MNIWNCIVVRANAIKSSHFSPLKFSKNDVFEDNYFKFAIYIVWRPFKTYIPVFESLDIWGIFLCSKV